MKTTTCFFLLFILAFASCTKKNKDCPLCPIVKSLTPDKGAHGDTIILVGKNFHSDLHSNIVKFNETVVPPSDMITGNTNQLKVRVPLNCGTGPVSVYINDELFSEPGPVFTYEGGKILNVLPLEGSKGDTVTITGEKFAMINNTVKFNGMKAVVTSESDTLIKAIVPKGCGTGLVNITLPNGVVIKGTIVFTYKYTYTVSTYAGIPQIEGGQDGSLTSATFKDLWAIEVDARSRSIYVADKNCIRKINNGNVTTFAGIQDTAGYLDNYGKNARLNTPDDIAINSSGELFIADLGNNCIRKITPNGLVSTFCGKGKQPGDQDGKGTNALLGQPYAVELFYDTALFIADVYSKKIKRCNMKAEVRTVVLNSPSTSTQLAIKDKQTILGADPSNNKIMEIGLSTSQINLFAGTGQYGVTDGDVLQATFSYPGAIATRTIEGRQEIYIVDSDSGLIRLIDSGNKVSTVMGSGPGYIDGIGRNTAFNAPSHLAFDPSNNTILYITDRGNKVIRKVLIE